MINFVKKIKKITVILAFCFVSVSCLLPLAAEAATLYLEPGEGECQQGDTFIVDIRIDTEECINVVEADLEFSKDILSAVDFSIGNSLLALWIEYPKINQEAGLISFSGGIPGGYCGKISGDPGESNLLGRIVLQAICGDEAKLEFLQSSQVLLNDGKGTPAELTTKSAVFTILAEKQETPKDEWQEEIEKDNIAPEPFEIEFHENFIIFSTTDKQTGIDYFLIKQGESDWEKADSPYPLADSTLQSIIKVKAVDKAGNERIAEYVPEVSEKQVPSPFWIIILIFISFSIIIYIAWRKIFKK